MSELGRNKIFLLSVTLNYFIRIMILPNIKIMKKILSPSTKMFYFLFFSKGALMKVSVYKCG